ncbi:hypothetical protein M9978_20890 [Sphingomonas sp. MG17]|jgi:hypothetical protein|uniref:Uncharacterized protein n=1 Tax=Sphingomonas tagetis TaxID=2949092 RepID=A0A9X2KMQ4_9SPHN|nr:hypothetical protein [Sphingomonas tagetis]MCP3732879.1 hypothetical protein [Sphingomonas tagetis]
MNLNNFLTGASAALLLASAGVAQANSAKSLSLSSSGAVRAASMAGDSNEGVGGFLIPAIAIIAIIGGILIISDDSDSN